MPAEPGSLSARLRYYARSLATLAQRVERPIATAWVLGVRRRSFVVRFRAGPTLACRDLMDLWVAKETCIDLDYQRHGTGIEPGWSVIDVGAGIGDFTIVAARACAPGRVVACEPSPAALAVLQRNLARNGAANVDIVAAAVASRAGTQMLTIDRNHALSSTSAWGRDCADVHVPSITLADLLSRAGGRCDLLKSDCEGAEYDFLTAADDATLARIERIVLEYHDADSRRHRKLLARLVAAGFRLAAPRVNPVHPRTGILYAQRH